ncbi:ER degradation-enhancing alpha-mannosidase-like protein 2 [Neocloeon triangulifer]|uniref:ER degradation-enhancing alpha-mannosidase-like protein 2 n=1 Tax=Neocloeon triangulifer TaxID=2078957 RepID=UPI00286ECCA9|nr:ER degradation-enhancing alpha-mannosidase-like protein 2 [Neocloeon triangulifer]
MLFGRGIGTATFALLILSHFCVGIRKYDKSDLDSLKEEVRQMFQHAYDGYLKYAYPYDELRPLTCDGIDTWGSYSLTLIDALDTLAVVGNYTEFRRVAELLASTANFDGNINVSVFETNIRIVGGLLSAHLMSHRAGVDLEPGWPCNGPLLRLAEDVAKRLIAAFDTPTGMPYGTVNLRHGVPEGETPITCTAGVGTFIVEFGALSRLTGDPLYEEVAMKAINALYHHRSNIGLMGNHIDILTGRWTAQDAGIGAGVDSYYEYLVKGAALLQKPELLKVFHEGREAINKYLKRDDWHLWVSMHKGQVTLPVFQSLEAYWPGLLSLIGDINSGMRSLHNYHQVWKQYGFTPEFYNIPQGEAGTNRESYPLRPELIESVMYLYRATRDPYLLDVGVDILRSIQFSSKTNCGYATIKDVRDHRKENRMESFFLAETTKYLYLLFDTDNFIHNNGGQGKLISTPWGECAIETGNYIFNTEAHPIDPGALQCCTGQRDTDFKAHVQSQLLASLDPEVFSSLRGERLQKRTARPPQKLKQSENKMIYIPTPPPPTSPSIKQQTTTAELKSFQHQESEVEDSLVVKVPATTTTLKPHSNLSGHIDGDITGVGTVELVQSEYRRKKKEIMDVDSSSPSTISPQSDTRPSFSGSEKSNAAYRNEQELLDISTESSASADSGFTLPTFVKQFLSTKQFDPQAMLERLRANRRYDLNATWSTDFKLLYCPAQPFLQRMSVMGEFYETLT